MARARERGEAPFVLVLDSLEDPQNVGTLLRSAEACGVHGVLFPVRRSAPIGPSAIKASAGAVEHLLMVPLDDLAGGLTDLHGRGLRIVGADESAPLHSAIRTARAPWPSSWAARAGASRGTSGVVSTSRCASRCGARWGSAQRRRRRIGADSLPRRPPSDPPGAAPSSNPLTVRRIRPTWQRNPASTGPMGAEDGPAWVTATLPTTATIGQGSRRARGR